MEIIHTPHLQKGNVEDKRKEILAYFHHSFDTYESLYSLLADEQAYYQRPEKLRHPLIFYFGHTATFFINKLVLAKQLKDRVNPQLESLFAIGVDEMNWDDLNDEHYDWPSVADVKAYRADVRQVVSDLIETMIFTLPIEWDSPMWPVLMAIEHERIHLETSSVLIRQLPIKHIKPKSAWAPSKNVGDRVTNELIPVAAGDVKSGKPFHAQYYGWDNEYGHQAAFVAGFKASKYLVSNGEFLEFVAQGGYQQPELWEEEGASWLAFTQATKPVFWQKSKDGYEYRALSQIIPLPMNWPVDVNYHEAKAFCNWKSRMTGHNLRLPTENEWLRLRDEAGLDDTLYHKGLNINLAKAASSEPVNINRHGDFFDVAGNVWQWTETPIFPMEGFKVHPLYDDFTTPTFDNKHNLMKGGSWISTGNEATRDSRYAFRRHFYQHCGFRYIQSDININVNDFDYESDTQVSQYCEMHYGKEYFNVPNFSKASAAFCLQQMQGKVKRKALDLGCAVGRATFELAKEFAHVDGVDFSARFIKTAFDMQERGEIRYHLIEEGELTSFHSQRLAALSLYEVRNKVAFAQGDACNLKAQFTDYDLIFMGNLIDRVYSPRQLLASVTQRLNIGGILIVASPFTWLPEYTERNEWLGGYKDENGETLTSSEALEKALSDNFKRIGEPTEIPFVIRETKRKHQHTFSEFHVFERTS